jgi:hypothetical protein
MPSNFDTVVIEFQNKGTSVASISIKSIDLETLEKLHGQDFKAVIADMAETLKKAVDEPATESN